jgi:hypothetical protein
MRRSQKRFVWPKVLTILSLQLRPFKFVQTRIGNEIRLTVLKQFKVGLRYLNFYTSYTERINL